MEARVNNQTGKPLAHYRQAFAASSPEDLAVRTGVVYNNNRFTLTLLSRTVEVSYPEGTAVWTDTHEHVSDMSTILLLRYLTEGAAAEGTGKFLAYAEVPWGSVYLDQFTGRCVKRLAYSYGSDLAAFNSACEALGGKPITGADSAYEIPFMQNLSMRLLLWQGDDEFPPSAQILFSDNFIVAFTAEDLAYVGDLLIGSMKQLYREPIE